MQNCDLTGTEGIKLQASVILKQHCTFSHLLFSPMKLSIQFSLGGHERAKRARLFELTEGRWFYGRGHSPNRPCGALFLLYLNLSLCASPLSCLCYLLVLIFSFFFSLSALIYSPPFPLLFLAHYLSLARDIFPFLRPNCNIAKFCVGLVRESSWT